MENRILTKYSLYIYLDSQVRNLTADLEQAREQLEEEQQAKSELQKNITKLTAEVQQWRSRAESDGSFLLHADLLYSIK